MVVACRGRGAGRALPPRAGRLSAVECVAPAVAAHTARNPPPRPRGGRALDRPAAMAGQGPPGLPVLSYPGACCRAGGGRGGCAGAPAAPALTRDPSLPAGAPATTAAPAAPARGGRAADAAPPSAAPPPPCAGDVEAARKRLALAAVER